MFQNKTIDELLPGMYVDSVLEQSGHLKIKSKGLVGSNDTIKALKSKGVLKLKIDVRKSTIKMPSEPQVKQTPPPPPKPRKEKTIKQPTVKTRVLSSGEQMAAATELYDNAKVIQSRFIKKLQANDSADIKTIEDLGSSVVESVFEMPDALSCLCLLNKSGKYLLEHSLNCSIFLAMFAKFKGLERADIDEFALAGLLMDIGMANMPKEITQSSEPLSELHEQFVITHVDIGLDMVERNGNISETVKDAIFNHHERIDGSGYPDAQRGEDISLVAKMAAIVDSYDAMTTARPHQAAKTPTVALRSLFTDKSYDQGLVQEFVKCLGVHPPGSLVKLDNSQLALVIKSNHASPLEPTVVAFYNSIANHYTETRKIDLAKSEHRIIASVRAEEFGINLPKFFKDVLINSI